jgi:hypothetical protein
MYSTGTQFIVEATEAQFQDGYCDNSRVRSSLNYLDMPTDGSDVVIWAAYADSYSTVYVTNSVRLVADTSESDSSSTQDYFDDEADSTDDHAPTPAPVKKVKTSYPTEKSPTMYPTEADPTFYPTMGPQSNEVQRSAYLS